MGKKNGKNNARRSKPKSITPPDSGGLKLNNQSLGLTLEPLKFVAKHPFNTISNPADTVMLVSKDNVEFLVSRSILMLASPYFKSILLTQESPSCETNGHGFEPPSMWGFEVAGTPITIDVDENSTIIDALLRFIYPIPSPSFAESTNSMDTANVLPFRQMGPIYEASQRFEISYVCQAILDISQSIISTNSFPPPGLTALRSYGVACRLNLDYDTKLKAARNALCIPTGSSPSAGLAGEGVSKTNIEHFESFHARAFDACYDLFSINPSDAYPIGLPDVYASFVACPSCCGVPPRDTMRIGAARWWQLYSASALEKLRFAPLDPTIFFENFLIPIFREAQNCHVCASVVHWKWCNIMPMLAKTIPAKVSEVSLLFTVYSSYSSYTH